MNLPFSVYDFFAYLATGFILLCALDYSFDGHWLLQKDVWPSYAVAYTVLAYILGHIVANVSSYLLEHKFLRAVLTCPEERLFDATKRTDGWAKLFPVYFQPFPAETQQRVLNRARAAGIDKAGRGLFFHCLPQVMAQAYTLTRLNTFLNLYGFCRNMAMAALLTIPLLLIGMIVHFRWAKLWWMLFAVVVAVGMFYRYLKFFKHYTEEVFRTFAEMPPPKV